MKIDRQVQAVESNEKIQSANCALKSEARLRVEMTQYMYPLSRQAASTGANGNQK